MQSPIGSPFKGDGFKFSYFWGANPGGQKVWTGVHWHQLEWIGIGGFVGRHRFELIFIDLLSKASKNQQKTTNNHQKPCHDVI